MCVTSQTKSSESESVWSFCPWSYTCLRLSHLTHSFFFLWIINMHIFFELNQYKGSDSDNWFLLLPNAILIIRVLMHTILLCVILHTVHRNFFFKKEETLGKLIVCVSFTYLGHFLHDFHAQGVTWKGGTLQPNVYFRIIFRSLKMVLKLLYIRVYKSH